MKINDRRDSASCCWHLGAGRALARAVISEDPGPEGRPGALSGQHRGRTVRLRAAADRQRLCAAGRASRGSNAPPWMRSPRHVAAFVALIASTIALHPVSTSVGFLIVASLGLFAMLVAFGVQPRHGVVVAVVGTLVIWYAFYKLLRVPLPWGVLRAIRVLTRDRIAAGELRDARRRPCVPAGVRPVQPVGDARARRCSVFSSVPSRAYRDDGDRAARPVTFFMAPIPAIAAIVSATAMAIFAGDVPGCLLRMPGTPASAAYTDEAYAMTRKGQTELALGAGLVFSAIGGLFGTAVLDRRRRRRSPISRCGSARSNISGSCCSACPARSSSRRSGR